METRPEDNRATAAEGRDDASGIASARPGRTSAKRLGRGLAALIGDLDQASRPEGGSRAGTGAARPDRTDGAPVPAAEKTVAVGAIRRNPANPRRSFDPDDLDELAASLRVHGFLSPIVVRPAAERGAYEIVAGERRWRAAQRAEMHHVPVIVREVDDRLALELAIVENVQRTDLNAMDEARGYEQLIERGYTQLELADVIGKSRSHIANTLRLMKLPESVRRLVADGAISAGHARALLSAPDPDALARRVIEEDLSVRQTEALVKRLGGDDADGTRQAVPREKDPDTRALERRLSDTLGASVSVDHARRGGRLVIRYRDGAEFEAICRRLETSGSPPDFD